MATLIAVADGNLTGATTFAATDIAAGALNMIRFSSATMAVSQVFTSVAFTVTSGKIIDGVLLWTRQIATGAVGTFKVDLQKGGVSQASVTVNAVDLPYASAVNPPPPTFFRFTGTATGDGGSNWTIVLTTAGVAGATFGFTANAQTTSLTRALRTTTLQTAAAGDDLYIVGELTGAGTKTVRAVAMDSTAATVYGNGAVNSTTVNGGGIHISNWGTLTYGTMNTTTVPATWDTATTTAVTLSGGNLIATNTGTTSTDQGARVASTFGKTTGKYYFEATFTNVAGGINMGIGVGTTSSTYTGMGGTSNNGGVTGALIVKSTLVMAAGSYWVYWTSGNQTMDTGELVCVAVDLDAHQFWFRTDAAGYWNSNSSANPATNSGGITLPGGTMVPFVTFGGADGTAGNVMTANFGASAFVGAVPSGFTAGWGTPVSAPVTTPGINYILRVAGDVIVYQYGTLNMGSSAAVSDSAVFLARTSGLDTTHTNAYTALIDGLVADGVWAKLDVLHVFATQNSTTALLNLVSSSYTADAIGSPTFTADRGFTGSEGSTTVYVRPNFIPSSAPSPKFIRDSAHISTWNVTNATSGGMPMGVFDASKTGMHVKYSDGNTYFYINGGNSTPGTAMANASGHLIANRSSGTAVQGYKNGASIVTFSDASGAVAGYHMIYLAANQFGNPTLGSSHQLAMCSIGSSLNSTEATAFYNRLRTYMTAVGVP